MGTRRPSPWGIHPCAGGRPGLRGGDGGPEAEVKGSRQDAGLDSGRGPWAAAGAGRLHLLPGLLPIGRSRARRGDTGGGPAC